MWSPLAWASALPCLDHVMIHGLISLMYYKGSVLWGSLNYKDPCIFYYVYSHLSSQTLTTAKHHGTPNAGTPSAATPNLATCSGMLETGTRFLGHGYDTKRGYGETLLRFFETRWSRDHNISSKMSPCSIKENQKNPLRYDLFNYHTIRYWLIGKTLRYTFII